MQSDVSVRVAPVTIPTPCLVTIGQIHSTTMSSAELLVWRQRADTDGVRDDWL
jgi:hypothetical protein